MRAIFEAKRAYANRPLFEFMRDETLSPRDRLAFFPCMAPFILAFGDLNKYVMRDEASTDPHQRLVNQHTYEDDHHWPWYLEDLTALGFDRPAATSQVLMFLYSDRTSVNRMLMPKLAHLLYDATPVERLAIIEAIEETGNVLFSLTAALARRIEAEEHITLRYLGDFHFQAGDRPRDERRGSPRAGGDCAGRRAARAVPGTGRARVRVLQRMDRRAADLRHRRARWLGVAGGHGSAAEAR